MATPQVPPRPARSQQATGTATTEADMPAPRIPQRPAGRRKDRSPSPSRYAPSPLNDLPRAPSRKSSASGLYIHARGNRSDSSFDTPARPPSVSLPSIGQEGNEYRDLEEHEEHNTLDRTTSGTPVKTSHIGSDLPLHAPRASLSKSSARAQVAAVTRTDSSQAAAAGLPSPGLGNDQAQSLKSKASSTFARSGSSLSTERPGSASQLDEQGIPHIGRYVPMLPNAGDVQAPSPAPGQGFGGPDGQDGPRKRHHGRKHSGREIFHGPPGSYGLHGHGNHGEDKFEKSWYAKHPDELAKEEQGHYSPALASNRPEWALSSDDLNKIVRDTGKGSGLGTSASIPGLPNEQIGYMASEEYTSRLHTPRSAGSKNHHRTSTSQSNVESPLRKTSFAQEGLDHAIANLNKGVTEKSIEGESGDVIHIDPPEDPINKVTGEGVDNQGRGSPGRRRSSIDAEAFNEERGYNAPILASDEVPSSEWMQPAVSPAFHADRRGSAQYDDIGGLHRHLSHLGGSASSSRHGSRPGSRPGSIHGMPALTKLQSHDDHEDRHTPLENVDEYEPLFPDDDGKPSKPMTQAERLKQRPDMRQRFPSQDIWEDTPHSLQLETEVTSPEPTEQKPLFAPGAAASSAFEPPETEAARKDAAKYGNEHTLTPMDELMAKSGNNNKTLASKSQLGMGHRFPSHDIWEDSPDHAALTTTVDGPQQEEEAVQEASAGAQPSIPPRPAKARGSEASQEAAASYPQVPARPPKKQLSTESSESAERKLPYIPDRPKPHVPARPTKQASRDSVENDALARTASVGSAGSAEGVTKPQKPAPPTKAKPNIPSRPVGGKIAALQAGFMADLNSRLKVGPQAQAPQPKEEEPPEEKAPLQDARKGRARGPARRKPAAAAAADSSPKPAGLQLSLSTVWTSWQSDADGSIIVPASTSLASSEGTNATVEAAKQDTVASVLAHPSQESPLVEEPNPLTKQATKEVSNEEPHPLSNQASKEVGIEEPAGDKEPELPVTSDQQPSVAGLEPVAAQEETTAHPAVDLDAPAPAGSSEPKEPTPQASLEKAEAEPTDAPLGLPPKTEEQVSPSAGADIFPEDAPSKISSTANAGAEPVVHAAAEENPETTTEIKE